jgi:hypothetical protein
VGSFQKLATEAAITIANGNVWLAIGLALLLGGLCLVFGVLVAGRVGLPISEAPVGETLGVGLACGLMVVAAWWAAIRSGGQSSFTPVAIGFALAIGLALLQRVRRPVVPTPARDPVEAAAEVPAPARRSRRTGLLSAAIAGGLFVVVVALIYGSTMTLSPRDGLQPVEKTDVAFYAVLGRGLAATGTESASFTSGFAHLPGDTAQAWYHWGELWLQSAVIGLFGAAPLAARYLVVLPLLLLAAGALTGTLVRRVNGTASRAAYLFGFAVCLLLTPIPVIAGPFFSVWANGLIYGIAVFGLVAVAALFALYLVAVMGPLKPGWPLACFAGSAVAFILPAHIVIAMLAVVGVGAVWALRIGRSLLTDRRLPAISAVWQRTALVTAIALGSTVAWGVLTGHGLGGGAPLARISPFNDSWRDTVAIVTLGAGMLLAIPLVWFLARRDARFVADLCLGTTALVVAGAIVWGWRLPAFNMFYFYFGGIAVFATPVAAVAVWWLLERWRAAGHRQWIVVAVVLCLLQLEVGLVLGVTRLQGRSEVAEPIPVAVLDAIAQLPADAKLAYACQEFEEISFVNSKLLGIDAHTDRRVVPMCFEADVNGPLLGATVDATIADPGFASAPQATLYPDSTARPSPAEVTAFLEAHGIDYIYADADHPNTLVPDAVPVASSAGFEILRLP